MAQNEMWIEYVALKQLRRWPRNPKAHALGSIAGSIDRFGFVNPPIIDERSGQLVAGHGRLEALEQMRDDGQQPPNRVRTDAENEDWLVPVLRGIEFNSDAEAEGYLLGDNMLSELGGWDNSMLRDMLADLDAEHSDMLETIGFDEERFRQAMADVEDVSDFAKPELEAGDVAPDKRLKPAGDGNWFYVEFYEQDERYEQLRTLIEPHLKTSSGKELDPDFFEKAMQLVLDPAFLDEAMRRAEADGEEADQ